MSQQAQPPPKPVAPAQQAVPAPDMVSIPREELERLATIDAELIELRKRHEELQRKPPASMVMLGANPNLGALKKVFEQQALRFGQTVTKAIFCSAVTAGVDENFTIQIDGKVRDANDVEKVKSMLEAEGFYALLKGTGLTNVRVQADGGQAGGCVVEIAAGLSVTKQSPEDFATPMHSELVNLGTLGASIPDKTACGRIGQLITQFRGDSSRVPVRKRPNFTAFWVRDGDDFTLCREDSGDWRVASKMLVKPSWEGILVMSREPNK